MEPGTTPPQGDVAARREARLATPRMRRELNTLAAMLRIYCHGHHGAAARDEQGLCADCGGLLAYARKRLANCPFGPDKPTCAHCQIHCYGPRQRETTRVVMRYAGPRMLWRHPLLAFAHLLVDGRRPAPPSPRDARAAAPVDTPDEQPAQAGLRPRRPLLDLVQARGRSPLQTLGIAFSLPLRHYI